MAILARGERAACDFTYHDATASRELKITVEQVTDPQHAMSAYKALCGPRMTPVRGIGNEAVTCAVDSKRKSYGQRVIGMVRDQIFTVTMITNAKNDPAMPREALEEKSRNRWQVLSSDVAVFTQRKLGKPGVIDGSDAP
jgi:hypothetical protein